MSNCQCPKCHRYWTGEYAECSSHTTYYKTPIESASGMYAMCEECYKEATNIEKLNYYRKVIDNWNIINPKNKKLHEQKWEMIKESVEQEIE